MPQNGCIPLITLLVVGAVILPGCLSGENSEKSQDSFSFSHLTYYTEEMPPYNFAGNGSLQGISVDLLEAVTGKMGDPVTRDRIRLVPWSHGYQAALTQNNTVLFAVARNPEREALFRWAGPLYTVQEVLFVRPGSGITIRNLSDLKKYRIGVVADDLAIPLLAGAGVNQSELVIEQEPATLVTMLENGEIDIWVYPEAAGRYFSERAFGNFYAFSVAYSFEKYDIFYAFSRDVPGEQVQRFQQALDSLKNDTDATGFSSYDRILGLYDPDTGFRQLQYLTEEWAPFNYLDGETPAGISVDVLEAVFRDMGVNLTKSDVRIVPLSEGFRAAQNSGTVLFSIVRTPEREPLYKWAGPFTSSNFVVFAPRKSHISITSPADLNRYRIGAVRSSIENSLLVSKGVHETHIIKGEAPGELLRLLETGEIDLWATGDLTGRNQMRSALSGPDAYEIVYVLSENDFYFIFSRDVPDTLVNTFQKSLRNIRNTEDPAGVSEYERIIYRYLGVSCSRKPFPDSAVTDLVNRTAADLERNASGTFHDINAGDAPYHDTAHQGLYVFVYDANGTMVAHANNILLVGVNFKGKTDVTGNLYHDEILAGALKNGTGWVESVSMSPAETNLYKKTTFYRLTRAGDGKRYIVCAGNFKGCGEEPDPRRPS